MPFTIRPASPADIAACGPILYRAFHTIAAQHNFPSFVPSAEAGTAAMSRLLNNPGYYGIVAERDGHIIGSNICDQRSSIVGILAISIDLEAQNSGVGRALMQTALDHFSAQNVPGIRLVQTAFHNRSLCLYTSLGFRVREPLSLMQGPPLNERFAGYEVRPAAESDLETCNELSRNMHGFDRSVALREAIGDQTARVVEHLGRITGYATDVGFRGHAVAETNDGLRALIGASPAFSGSGFLVPSRNHELFAWCLSKGLRLVMQLTLMTLGLYNEPSGAWLASNAH
jgi:predicted N-acetyltransferase YhbS